MEYLAPFLVQHRLDGGMRAKMEAGCGRQEILSDGMRDKILWRERDLLTLRGGVREEIK